MNIISSKFEVNYAYKFIIECNYLKNVSDCNIISLQHYFSEFNKKNLLNMHNIIQQNKICAVFAIYNLNMLLWRR